MADVVLSTVDLDVFGGPTSLDVSVDFGQTGVRGSRIWAGSLGPVIDLASQAIQLYDWYINTSSGRMYQYILEVGNPTWSEVLNLTLPQKSLIASTTFTAGTTTIAVPTSALTPNAGTTVSNYIIRYSIKNINPIASSFTYTVSGGNINITINGYSFDGSTWTALSGSKDVHLFISYEE